jgi:hypothetical protein
MNQNQGIGQEVSNQSQSQGTNWQSQGDNSNTQGKPIPEIENPQPLRKEEEPIVAEGNNAPDREYTQDNDNRNVANTGTTTSNSDYKDSNVGFKKDEDKSDDREKSQKPSRSGESQEWRDQQSKMDS